MKLRSFARKPLPEKTKPMSDQDKQYKILQRKALLRPFSPFAQFCIDSAGIRATHKATGTQFAKYELWQYCGGKPGEETAKIIGKCHPEFTFRMVEIKAEGIL